MISKSLTVTLIIVAISFIVITSYFLKKEKIPEKYSLLWYLFSILILLVAFFPNMFNFISQKIGFEVMSNMMIAIIIGILLLVSMFLTIMISDQKKKNIILIQELSIFKEKVERIKK
ncbi:MAG: DUF2304 domain-containing protein [Bacilli bacterium]|nr:DUF2304 domain-containing protein [Bacilli bacterium]